MPTTSNLPPRLGLRHGRVAKERHLQLTETSTEALRLSGLAYQLWCQRPVSDAVLINRAIRLLGSHATELLRHGDQDAINAELTALHAARG
ncbi:hypothetical protein SAMN06265365_113142 [Tistlia consotensis]|uniref:Uncharacterized protein n=1 Tax=Tistlia consotensis USBA 355 TaxID=560819 RepID=A0A1Y6C185_9PROT|nr:hypothetical protein [Tistlia consotensis]SMF40242.1 hypothetical protein SAMN05428998_1143 [Tistlia consotensis USBA 355]SNR75197.1 hypothetical protein SAMN06265365_113142 [Tistlia consotensis]